MRVGCVLAMLLTLAATSTAMAADAGERRGRFKELARRYAEAEDQAASGALLSELFALVDVEVIDSLRSGGPFASAPFIQERLEAFSEEWGGATFRTVQPERDDKDTQTLLLFTVTRVEPRGSLRVYGRARGEISLLAAAIRDGTLDLHAWPGGRDGAFQFLASWLGAPTGRGSRPLSLELWRRGAREGITRVWSSDEPFPEGLWAMDWSVRGNGVLVRHEVRYPGWKPGCAAQTELEDLYRQPSAGDGLVLLHRRVVHGWHRELHATVTRFFAALGAGDMRTLAELVPNPSVRARLPRELRIEPACDERTPDPAGMVIVAATRGREPPLAPWSLSWRRGPHGWRLAAAAPVLQ